MHLSSVDGMIRGSVAAQIFERSASLCVGGGGQEVGKMIHDKTERLRELEGKVLGSLGKARQLVNAYRASYYMPNWKKEKYMDTIYLLRTYFLEKDYSAMSRSEFSKFWSKYHHFAEAAFTWDYGMEFFRSWVLTSGLPVWVRTNIVNVMSRMSSFVLPKTLREPFSPKQDESQLLGEVSKLNPHGAMIMIDLWGKPVTAGLIVGLITLARTDVLSVLLERTPDLIPFIVKAEDVVLYLFRSGISAYTISEASNFIEARCPGLIREMVSGILVVLDVNHASTCKKRVASRLYGHTGR